MSADKDLNNFRQDAGPCGAAEQAHRCRRLAQATYDRTIAAMLERMAADYEQREENNDR